MTRVRVRIRSLSLGLFVWVEGLRLNAFFPNGCGRQQASLPPPDLPGLAEEAFLKKPCQNKQQSDSLPFCADAEKNTSSRGSVSTFVGHRCVQGGVGSVGTSRGTADITLVFSCPRAWTQPPNTSHFCRFILPGMVGTHVPARLCCLPQASNAPPVSESGTVDPSEGTLESDFQKRMDESWVRRKDFVLDD